MQWSICDGVAKALRSEVGRGMEGLRYGQRRGVKFEVPENVGDEVRREVIEKAAEADEGRRDRCGECGQGWAERRGTLVAFACGHSFHLACVTGEEEEDDTGEPPALRTVGTKITKATLLKPKLSSGCGVCHRRREREILV